METAEKQIQISMSLYNALCRFHLGGEGWDAELAEVIRDGLEERQDRRARHKLFTMTHQHLKPDKPRRERRKR